MPLSPDVTDALDALGVPVALDAPLDRRVWWRVGGPADALVTARTREELRALQALAQALALDVFVLGNGSNLLVSDEGVQGLVVELAGELADARADGDRLHVGGGLKLTVLLARAAKHGWPGLEAMAGIPGTVGGAVVMNAGTSLGELADRLLEVELVLRGGELVRLPTEAIAPRYRATTLPRGAVVSGATLALRGDADESRRRAREFLDRRKATQPLDLPSCGSTFTNPAGDHAGRLIEAAGLKGFAIGGAMVSPRHANFVVNTGGATAADVRAVIEHVRAEVEARFGVRLEPEVKLAGRWPSGW